MEITSREQETAPQQDKRKNDEKKTSGDCWLGNDKLLCSVLNCSQLVGWSLLVLPVKDTFIFKWISLCCPSSSPASSNLSDNFNQFASKYIFFQIACRICNWSVSVYEWLVNLDARTVFQAFHRAAVIVYCDRWRKTKPLIRIRQTLVQPMLLSVDLLDDIWNKWLIH